MDRLHISLLLLLVFSMPVRLFSQNQSKDENYYRAEKLLATSTKFQQDGMGVGEMHLISTNFSHPTLYSWKYPLPEDSVIFRIHRVVIHIEEPKVVRLQMICPNRGYGFGNEPYMMPKRGDYFVKHLMGAELPKEYTFKTNT